MDLLERINRHLRQLAPHQQERAGMMMLVEARDEIERRQKAEITSSPVSGRVQMIIIEGGDFKITWECSGCKTIHKATAKFEKSKSCPQCGQQIEKWIGLDEEFYTENDVE